MCVERLRVPDLVEICRDDALELAAARLRTLSATALVDELTTRLEGGDYAGYNRHCVEARSDARDAGQVFRYLLGPLRGRVLDLTYSDASELYGAPDPTWVAAALFAYGRERS